MTGTQLQPFYPEFVPNQVLTNTQLNQLRTYLDEQTRVSRIRLVGTGVVCGLTWTVSNAEDLVTVRAGYDITSEGYLIGLDEATEFAHVRP